MEFNTLIAVLIVVVIFAIAIYVSYSKQFKEQDISNDIKSKLAKIPSTTSDNFHELKSILIEHDKLLDYYLKKKSFKGETLGERLKSAKNSFDYESYNKLWKAHKLRNILVHEFEANIKSSLIKQEIENFRKVLNTAR